MGSRHASLVLVLFGLGSSLACGSSTNGGTPSTDADAGPDTGSPPASSSDAAAGATSDSASPSHEAGSDAGASDAQVLDAEVLAEAGDYGGDSSTYPAFPVDYPQVIANQDAYLSSPVVVTITWPGDTNAATWEAFGDKIGATTYWAAATGEYGVGAAKSGAANHIRLTEPAPASISADDLAAFVAANVGVATSDAGPPWPAPTTDAHGNSQTIYSLFIPAAMSVLDGQGGTSFCDEGAGGYHDNVVVAGKPVSYAVNLDCTGFTTTDVEETAAHEYAEAATDPYPSYPDPNAPTDMGYAGFDEDHFSWEVYTGFQDELGDACEFWPDAYYQETGSFPYWVQRIWSNKAALQGHNPCAPQPAGGYFGVTLFPSQESTITVDLTGAGDTTHTTKGFHAAVGQSLTFQIGFFSEPGVAPWTVAYDFPSATQLSDKSGNAIGNGAATVTIDHATGQNGEKAYVTVTPTTAGPLGFQIMAITWDPPPAGTPSYLTPRYLPILILNK